jgi:3-oxoacyl-[acyl-carrier-protein] synthase-1
MNGESYRAEESMLALARVYRTRREHFRQMLPATSIGEVSAAAGAMTVIMATMAMVRKYAPGDIAMCEVSSDSGPRAACLIEAGNRLGR